jgi:hypothetical protein
MEIENKNVTSNALPFECLDATNLAIQCSLAKPVPLNFLKATILIF